MRKQKNNLIPAIGIAARPSHRHGLGVFATVPVHKSGVVEECPFLELTCPEDHEHLSNYVFNPGNPNKKVRLALGFGSLYNHSYTPNAEVTFRRRSILVRAIRDIDPGEEILINYNGDPHSQKRVWFDAH